MRIKRLLYLLSSIASLAYMPYIVLSAPKPASTGPEVAHCAVQPYAMPLNTVVFSPDGKTLFSSFYESSIKQWDLSTRKVTKVLSGNQGNIYALTISPNGQYLASGSVDGTIQVWQAANGTLVRTQKTTGTINALKISPNGQILASSSGNTIKLWQLSTGRLIKSLQGREDQSFQSLDFTLDSKILASGGSETVFLWDISSNRVLNELTWRDPQASTGFAMLKITPDGKSVIAGPSLTQFGWEQNAIYRWDLATGNSLPLESLLDDWVYGIAVTPDSNTLVTGNFGITLWDLATGKKIYHSRSDSAGDSKMDIYGLTMAPDGKTLALITQNKGLKLWDMASRKVSRILLTDCPES